MRVSFGPANSEGDVEKQFVTPLLSGSPYLAIPDVAILSQESLQAYEINKGKSAKLYKPDYTVYCSGFPILVVEVKEPDSDLSVAFAEAQLYAHQLNSRHPSKINPAQIVVCTDGRELWAGKWDNKIPTIRTSIDKLLVGSALLAELEALCGWDAIQKMAGAISAEVSPRNWFNPSEQLGANRVTLSKVGHNSLYPELDPLLRRFFNPADEAAEAEIVERAYVTTDDVTKYERTFETYLRSRVVPLNDTHGLELKTAKRDAPDFSSRLNKASINRSRPYMQLVIGGVGSGKTTFLKRYFRHSIPASLESQTVYCRVDFNEAPDDLSDVRKWLCSEFIERIRIRYPHLIDLETESGLRSIFSNELKDNRGAYSFLKKASEEKYNERVAQDILSWLSSGETLARAVARMIGGDRGLHLVVAFDNVDRRDREAQLSIFQTGQWFMSLTHATLIMTLRDETYEAFRDEKPLDAFPKTGNFYIRPPRFIDMVSKRLDLAMEHASRGLSGTKEYDIPGLGKVVYPDNALGAYLSAVYVDLFRRKRNITLILEALAGKNARRALEMFTAILTSAHFDTRDFTNTILSAGSHRIHEPVLLRALMRTNYLYFTPAHGFIKNIYDFPSDCERPSHFLKAEILQFLIENRKKVGDINIEGYYTLEYLTKLLTSRGYIDGDVEKTINSLLKDELLISDNLTRLEADKSTAVRVHPSGYVHMRILSRRLDYIAAAALVTPMSDRKVAEEIGMLWKITSPHTDAKNAKKKDAALLFIKYLEDSWEGQKARAVGVADSEHSGEYLVRGGREALGITEVMNATSGDEFDRLFE
jgi:Type I restriction enzyme R protein N terminus (HSDR_N)